MMLENGMHSLVNRGKQSTKTVSQGNDVFVSHCAHLKRPHLPTTFIISCLPSHVLLLLYNIKNKGAKKVMDTEKIFGSTEQRHLQDR